MVKFDDDGCVTEETEELSDKAIEAVKDALRSYVQDCSIRDLRDFVDYVALHVGCQLSNERYRQAPDIVISPIRVKATGDLS